MGAEDLALHYAHVILASIWIGYLAVVIAASFRGKETLLAVNRSAGLLAFGSLILLAIVGVVMASTKYSASPSEWFAFGTYMGRIGEKMITWLILAALGGYLNHVEIKKVEETGKVGRFRAIAAFALIASLGAALLGSMLSLGV
ncbi:MAG: hypothetical protein F7B20_01840 [Aeropyrum sp.]|nr:hypothetical protein [Aeropyrum sp.]MCE4616367.1 hypothetical protein [Aeropyrum sp.]